MTDRDDVFTIVTIAVDGLVHVTTSAWPDPAPRQAIIAGRHAPGIVWAQGGDKPPLVTRPDNDSSERPSNDKTLIFLSGEKIDRRTVRGAWARLARTLKPNRGEVLLAVFPGSLDLIA